MARDRTMNLGLLLTANGAHFGSWRLPEATPEASFTLDHYVQIAKLAERGLLDFMFIADSLGLYPMPNPSTAGRMLPISHLEPFTLLSALAAVTRNIGFIGSATTTYNQPFQVARIIASLDHISGGRGGWNLITSGNPAEAWNFGYAQHPDHADRYERAGEFADVVIGLWESWTPDAFGYDKAAGQYFEPAKMRVLNHAGAFFNVRGPLNLARSPQGRPVIAQAGASEAGRSLAARVGEVIFTAQQNFEGAKAFYDDMRRRVVQAGRNADAIRVFPGVVPIVGRTDAAAQAARRRIDGAFDPVLGIEALSVEFGIDMSIYPLDEPLPADLPRSATTMSRRDLLTTEAERDGLTLRQLAGRTASLGHWTLCGSPATIADALEAWHEGGAADGFILMPATQPDGFRDFVDLVVPELQRRGLFRTAYDHSRLRENLGLCLPV
jgi:FMN-dependent oxidoreductase (nitrilotriacetate monooxygenase family)